jgi:hypothetical protein
VQVAASEWALEFASCSRKCPHVECMPHTCLASGTMPCTQRRIGMACQQALSCSTRVLSVLVVSALAAPESASAAPALALAALCRRRRQGRPHSPHRGRPPRNRRGSACRRRPRLAHRYTGALALESALASAALALAAPESALAHRGRRQGRLGSRYRDKPLRSCLGNACLRRLPQWHRCKARLAHTRYRAIRVAPARGRPTGPPSLRSDVPGSGLELYR